MLSQEIEKAAMSKMRIPAGLRGWTYPNTADKGSSMATVDNYWHNLKSATVSELNFYSPLDS